MEFKNPGWERPDFEYSAHAEQNDGQGNIRFRAIGYISSPYQDPMQIPMVPLAINDTEGSIEIMPDFAEGLEKLEAYSYIQVTYHLHRPLPPQLKVKPPFQNDEFGVFATRFPCRPNGIGTSLLQLVKVEGNTLHVRGLDMIDGEAVLDIKPYMEDFDKAP